MANDKYWNEKIETLPPEEIKKIQLQKLKEQVKHCYENSAFYRKKFDSVGLKPEDIKTLEDLQKIPFTIKSDLRDNYPFGMVAAKSDEIVEIHASSGTTGNPIIGSYTKGDMDVWQELMARCIYTVGGRRQDIIHIAYGYGLFTGGLGFTHGGVIFSLADYAFAQACNYGDNVAVAVQVSINFRKPSVEGDTLTAEATRVSDGKTTGLYNVTVKNIDKTVAYFTGLAFKK